MDFEKVFEQHFGCAPEVIAAAPGRLEVLGNHTDYNQGLVLSCAVEQVTRFGLVKRPGTACRLLEMKNMGQRSFDLADIDTAEPKSWANYIRGMIIELRRRNIDVGAFDGAIFSTVPMSAGMSSSAALEISVGFALQKAFGFELDKVEMARAGQGVENNYLGLKTGLLDQFSSIFGRKNSLILSDFRTVEVLQSVSVPGDYKLVVVNSMQKHNLVDSEYNVRRQDCENAAAKLGVKALRDVSSRMLEDKKNLLTDREYRRAKHVVGENERVLSGIEALKNGDVKSFGELLYASHESSRVNFENSTPELDLLVDFSRTIPGCAGARLSGGGFGGISIHLVEGGCAEEYKKRISVAYKMAVNIEPEVFICALGDGARVLK